MSKGIKKILVILLALTMLFSTASFAWAEDVVTYSEAVQEEAVDDVDADADVEPEADVPNPSEEEQPVVEEAEEPAVEDVNSDESEPVISDEEAVTEEAEQEEEAADEPVISDEIEEPAAPEQPLRSAPAVTSNVPLEAGLLADSGEVSEGVTYTLEDGVLTISGNGPMIDYNTASASPWYSQRTSITKIIISEGVTRIGNRAFYDCSNLTSISIPDRS